MQDSIETKTEPRELTPEEKEEQKKRVAMILLLRKVKAVFQYIDKCFPNRKSRKAFWSQFYKDDKIRINVIDQLLSHYGDNRFLDDELKEAEDIEKKQQKIKKKKSGMKATDNLIKKEDKEPKVEPELMDTLEKGGKTVLNKE